MTKETLFLEDKHPVSARLACLEDDGNSIWLYLSEPGTRKPAGDAWVYNRIPAPPMTEIQSYRGGPPPAAQEYASESALCKDPLTSEWSFLWSSDGEAVAVFKEDRAVAFLSIGQKGGYSRELIRDGPWGHPWSEKLFRQTFGVE